MVSVSRILPAITALSASTTKAFHPIIRRLRHTTLESLPARASSQPIRLVVQSGNSHANPPQRFATHARTPTPTRTPPITRLFGTISDAEWADILNWDEPSQDGDDAPMRNVYQEWTVEQDRQLFENRHLPSTELSTLMGRGMRGVQNRLEKLRNVDSPAYERLFAKRKRANDGEDDEDGLNPTKGEKLVPVVEVLRRIKWDESLPSAEFTIKYLDRISETLETCSFDNPNESVKGTEELFVFAIPEHRIYKVLYKERVVWDRDARLDRVFGSMNGDGDTIMGVMEGYEEWQRQEEELRRLTLVRQKEAIRNMEAVLGSDRFQILKGLSSTLMVSSPEEESDVTEDDGLRAPEDGDEERVGQYVQEAMALFSDARSNDGANEEETTNPRNQNDMEALEMLSELVVCFPRPSVRQTLLLDIQDRIDILEGRNPATTSTNRPPIELRDDDLEEKFIRGSGAGGQKVNKTSNRVVLLHKPTSIRVECQDTRSLTQNRKIARKRLLQKLDDFYNGESSKSALKAQTKSEKKSKNKAKKKQRQKKKQKQ